MDVTSINLGEETRDLLADYRDEQGFDNYNEAVRSLLQHAEANNQ